MRHPTCTKLLHLKIHCQNSFNTSRWFPRFQSNFLNVTVWVFLHNCLDTSDIVIRPNSKVWSWPVVIFYRESFSKASCPLTYPRIWQMRTRTYNNQLFKYRFTANSEFGAKLDVGSLFNYRIRVFTLHKISSIKKCNTIRYKLESRYTR